MSDKLIIEIIENENVFEIYENEPENIAIF
jgi:hypothetical protein